MCKAIICYHKTLKLIWGHRTLNKEIVKKINPPVMANIMNRLGLVIDYNKNRIFKWSNIVLYFLSSSDPRGPISSAGFY